MLAGKNALVTGGASGIGAAIVRRFVAEGASYVISCDINEELNKKLADDLNNGKPSAVVFPVKCDVSKEEEIVSAVEQAKQIFARGTSRFDVLVNNAVRFEFGHLLPPGVGSKTGTDREATSEIFTKIMSVNLLGYANFIKHVGREMHKNEPSGTVYTNEQPRGTSTIDARGRGSIVNVCSVSSWIAQPEFVPYNCSKGAVLQLTRCCAKDFAQLKVRVNAVSPGSIETEGSHAHMALAGLSLEEGRKEFGNCCPLKRQGAPEEVASLVAFLASDNSSFMTGANLVVDGGGTI